MRRRSRAGGEPVKTRRRKAAKLKPRDALKAASRRSSSAASQDTQVARLTRELNEAREQQTATSEVLQVISSSPGDLQPVFDIMLADATSLCEANFGVLVLYDNGTFRNVAMHNPPPAFAELRRRDPVIPAGPLTGLGRAAATKQLVHIFDYAEDAAYKQRDPAAVSLVERAGARTHLVVPMLKEEELGDHDRAIEDFTKAIEINPQNADLYYNRGLAHRAKRQIDHAIADYTSAIEINPRHAAAYNSRSNAFEATGEIDRAIADHRKAIEISPR